MAGCTLGELLQQLSRELQFLSSDEQGYCLRTNAPHQDMSGAGRNRLVKRPLHSILPLFVIQ
jgi:hypothetical protein